MREEREAIEGVGGRTNGVDIETERVIKQLSYLIDVHATEILALL